jgi:hypothetical protein
MSGGSAVVFPLSQMNILRDEGRALYVFFVNHFVYLLAHLHTFLDLLQLAAPPRGAYHL